MVNDRWYDEMLYDSCKTFNIDVCSTQSLIESGTNPLKAYVTKKNKNIKTDVVIFLLSSVDYKNINDFDIFEYVCSDNIDIELLKLLITKGLEINSLKNGINIVEKYATTSNPNVDVFKLLLDQGIPMCSDIRYGYKIVIKKVTCFSSAYDDDDYYYDYVINENDKIGKTALYYYIITRPRDKISLDVINCLISYEKEVRYYTYRSYTALYYYVGRCDVKREIFNALYDNNYQNNERMNILHNYLRRRYKNKHHVDNYIIDRLLDGCKDKDILVLFNESRYNIIYTIIKRYKYSIQDLLSEYISNCKVRTNIIKCMIDEGAVLYRYKHVNEYFKYIHKTYPKVVKYILKNGIDDTDNNTINIMPLFPIARDNHDVLSILKLCKPYIDDINKTDEYGCSILYHCVYNHNDILVEWLVDNGADINIVTTYGHTCISVCIVMAYSCIPEISKIYIKILEIILSKLPTIECIKKTVDYITNSYICIDCNNKLLLEICIKYFILVDHKYICSMYPSYIEFITECEKEIIDMRQTKINGMDMLTVMYKLNKHTKKRYVKHPVFTEWAKRQYKFYNQIIYNAIKLIEQSNEIDNMIEEISVDNNRLSILPLEIRHLIFSYAFL
ncbi:Ankyrin [NY_014 poxvirus]|uniref:Ankyrin n=1 Tax=NY_014 poxvirus TaxID=2025360 RepID=UPI000B99F864|nr:Ankyrin [NY_014 poxvirus]AST09597.1 Ankyrin [NY_014 poxvirus]